MKHQEKASGKRRENQVGGMRKYDEEGRGMGRYDELDDWF